MPPAAEPAISADGRCAGEGCRKRRPPVAVRARDPFCSSRCCKAFYGVLFKSDRKGEWLRVP